ncbi:hypothetical protein [Rhizobium sp. 768_B6_N1_8]|jgi:hypothetical protein|uniref:hypothetical protein n=1 Tax=unclassified Rhizobium TaxID=2613769 RepID=UPI003F230719
MKIFKYIFGVPAMALGGAYFLMALWTQLIRAELVPNSSFAWFPTVAIAWGAICIIVGSLLLRSSKKRSSQ